MIICICGIVVGTDSIQGCENDGAKKKKKKNTVS